MESTKKSLIIRIRYEDGEANRMLSLRHTLVDTLEERGIGYVWNVGTGIGYVEVCLDLMDSTRGEAEIRSILDALGVSEQAEFNYDGPG